MTSHQLANMIVMCTPICVFWIAIIIGAARNTRYERREDGVLMYVTLVREQNDTGERIPLDAVIAELGGSSADR